MFIQTVRAIAEAIILDIDPLAGGDIVDGAENFISAVHARMQPMYRIGLLAIAAAFNIYAIFRTGRTFSGLSPERRRKLLLSWLEGPVEAVRNFARFFLTMTLLFYYDSGTVLRAGGVDVTAHRKIQCFYAGN